MSAGVRFQRRSAPDSLMTCASGRAWLDLLTSGHALQLEGIQRRFAERSIVERAPCHGSRKGMSVKLFSPAKLYMPRLYEEK